MTGKFQPLYRFSVNVARIPVSLVTRRHWYGAENLPHDTGFIAAANHISEFDSMTFMHFLVDNGIPVRMMAKEELFHIPFLGWLMEKNGQVRVYRGTDRAKDSLADAKAALLNGECIGIYPEGTLTRDPRLWPMSAKTGVGRLALATRVPVIPIAQWGAQYVLGRYCRIPNLFHRADVTVVAGPPVKLDDLYDHADEHWAQVEATDRVMAAIRSQLEEIRGVKAPEHIHDFKRDGGDKKKLAAADKELMRLARKERANKFWKRWKKH